MLRSAPPKPVMTRLWSIAAALLLAPPLFSAAFAQTIALEKQDATVWAQEQEVSGTIEGAENGILIVDGEQHPFTAVDGEFAVTVWLGPGTSEFVACTVDETVCSDPLQLTLGYTPRPEAELRAAVDGQTITLSGEVLDNPAGGSTTTTWSADPDNPASVTLSVDSDYVATASIPEGSPPGEYYFQWVVEDADGESRTVRTFVTLQEDGSITPFVMETDAAAWVDDATLYGIAPYYFVRFASSRFVAIRLKLPELAQLGVNTLWLQPIYQTHGGGQSYDVTDFFKVWSSFGTEQQLHDLIEAAHDLGMRVLFDLVPNHSSIEHPYAQDAIEHGPNSHYYDFYQREFDSVPYSQHYNSRQVGQMSFVYYFWTDLVNLNYHNPEVRRHMIEASRYWVENFNIDGYRVDVAWGPDARNPEFFKEWRLALKRIRPDLLLLGEDKATLPHVFEERFDAAYDWTPSQSWVSQWMWQAFFSSNSNPTIFNYGAVNTRATRLRDALTNFGNGWADGARVMRFMENNDTFRFLPTHELDRTKMAAALLYSLPGIPLMYNGQEVGFPHHPYATNTIFTPNNTIQSQDQHGLFPYYQHLLNLREQFSSLRSHNWQEVTVEPANIGQRTFSYHRWDEDEHVFAYLNMSSNPVDASLTLPIDDMELEEGVTYYVTDLFTGDYVEAQRADLASWAVTVPGFTTTLFAVGDTPATVPVSTDPAPTTEPLALSLDQNFPNPFMGRTTIGFQLNRPGSVQLRVVDLLGRQVALLVDDVLQPGNHAVDFDAHNLASGTYIYILEAEGIRETRRMLLVR